MLLNFTYVYVRSQIGLDQQNHNFARASRFFNFCIFLYYCCSNATVKLPSFTFYGGREHKTDNSFPFLFQNLRLISTDATNVKKFLEKLNWFRRYSFLKCPYVSKNSNKMAGNSKIKA